MGRKRVYTDEERKARHAEAMARYRGTWKGAKLTKAARERYRARRDKKSDRRPAGVTVELETDERTGTETDRERGISLSGRDGAAAETAGEESHGETVGGDWSAGLVRAGTGDRSGRTTAEEERVSEWLRRKRTTRVRPGVAVELKL